jgi:hypothetical protein
MRNKIIAGLIALAIPLVGAAPAMAAPAKPEPAPYCGPFVPLPGSTLCKAKLKGFG